MSETVFSRLQQLLVDRDIPHDVLRHEPVFTSEQAAEIRGTSLASGAKALVCKADGEMMMFVLPADRKLDSRSVRRTKKIKSLRFASAEDVLEVTGLRPGSIPPFGSLFALRTLCDERLADQPTINFNAGDHAISICMTYADYQSLEQPELGRFAAE